VKTDASAGLLDPHAQPRLRSYAYDLLRHRHFIAELAKTQLLADTASTRLGLLWNFLSPMLLIAIYFLVFGVIYRGLAEIETFYSFLTISLFAFLFSSRTMQSSAGVLSTSIGMMQNLRFPRASLPLAAVYRELLVYLASLPIMFIIMLIEGIRPDVRWLALVTIVIAQVIFNAGLGLAVARLSSHVPDVRNVIPYLARLLIYMSGVMYTLDFLTDRGISDLVVSLFHLNPFYAFVALTRGVLLPTQSVVLVDALAAGAWTVAMALGGIVWFLRRETEYARG
jgi:teichoic acid transport system permease protein